MRKEKDYKYEEPTVCPECGGKVIKDWKTREYICSKCGLVLGKIPRNK